MKRGMHTASLACRQSCQMDSQLPSHHSWGLTLTLTSLPNPPLCTQTSSSCCLRGNTPMHSPRTSGHKLVAAVQLIAITVVPSRQQAQPARILVLDVDVQHRAAGWGRGACSRGAILLQA